MRLVEGFLAWGHPNIRAGHRTTLMVTREPELTPRGDCIVAVASEKGLSDLSPKLREAARSEEARITLILEAEGHIFTVSGRGDLRLTLSHPRDMVVRRSRYICPRTLMIKADKAACDIPEKLRRTLQRRIPVRVTVIVESNVTRGA
jgi:hypothetical protein